MRYHKKKLANKLPIIVNIPHSSINLPKAYTDDYLISAKDISSYAKYMADIYADEVYSALTIKSGFIISGISRIIVDMERFWDDDKEKMSTKGMGALYTKAAQGKTIREVSTRNAEKLHRLYNSYHKDFTELVEKCRDKFGFCLILDCHTFPQESRAYDLIKMKKTPDICLGTDKYHSPAPLVKLLEKSLQNQGYSVALNRPFSGTIIPAKHYKKDKNVYSMMIEINRDLYLDEKTLSKKKGWEKKMGDINTIILETINIFINERNKFAEVQRPKTK